MKEKKFLRAALAQINTTVGDLQGNRMLVEASYRRAIEAGASLVVFPELTLTGYPPEDLLLKPSFLEDSRSSLDLLAPVVTRGLALVGFAEAAGAGPRNAAALLGAGRILDIYHKCTLPNYGVFDEKRYFVPGVRCPVYETGIWRIAVNICEDLWIPGGVPALQAGEGRANLMINLSASPFHSHKGTLREKLITDRARRFGIPVLYANLVGGQDELVFDGQGLAADGSGCLLARGPQLTPHLLLVDLPLPERAAASRDREAALEPPVMPSPPTPGGEIAPPVGPLELMRIRLPLADDTLPARPRSEPPAGPPSAKTQSERHAGPPSAKTRPERTTGPALLNARPAQELSDSLNRIHPVLGEDEEVYRALMLGLRDYVLKNSFRGVVIGLSGGIDSALTAIIAADALGPESVAGISMPSGYTSKGARDGAAALARNLEVEFHEVSITGTFDKVRTELAPVLRGAAPDVTEENIQARLRGMLLMAFSNKLGHLVLATGNKSEVAVGYCTLYGDMVGGFSVLKDVLKTHVYRLARWRNAQTPDRPPIPDDTLTRPPSAELRPDQKDTDSLPPYETLDPIVKAMVEEESSPREIVAAGFDRKLVDRVFRMIQGNEYKRRQAAPGIKITPRAFGKDRRYPLTNRYRPREV